MDFYKDSCLSLEHPVFSSEVNDGSQKGRSVLYVVHFHCLYTNRICNLNCFQQVYQNLHKQKLNQFPYSILSKKMSKTISTFLFVWVLMVLVFRLGNGDDKELTERTKKICEYSL